MFLIENTRTKLHCCRMIYDKTIKNLRIYRIQPTIPNKINEGFIRYLSKHIVFVTRIAYLRSQTKQSIGYEEKHI